MTDLDIDAAIWHLKGTDEDFALARRLIRRVFAAQLAASQPAQGERKPPMQVWAACSVCYGSGTDVAGLPCPFPACRTKR